MSPAQTSDGPLMIFISGAIAICAMILPGISGAFILVLLGSYNYILNAVHEMNFKVIALVGAGAVVGLLSFSKILNWTFKKYTDLTLAVLSGFLLGSLTKVWPWKKTLQEVTINHKTFATVQENIIPNYNAENTQVFLAVLMAIAGFLLIYLLEKFATKKS
jgi:putative membrane protein